MYRKSKYFILSLVTFYFLSVSSPVLAYSEQTTALAATTQTILTSNSHSASTTQSQASDRDRDDSLKFAPIHGFRMAYQDFGKRGEGQTILFIEGYGLTHEMWKSQADFFAKDYRVIVPDLQGYGGSTTLHTVDDFPSYTEYANDLAALLDYLHINKVHVVGLSMGSMIAVNFYQLYPKRVRDLVLASLRMAPDPGSPAFLLNFANQIKTGGQVVALSFLPFYFAPNTSNTSPIWLAVQQMILDCSVPGLVISTRYLALRPSAEPVIRSLKVHTLLIAGELDQLNPNAPAHHQLILSLIPDHLGKLIIFPGVGHMVNMEAPTQFNQAVADFLPKNFDDKGDD
jgi:pimeloyl-ACP methyl ester carboxylesterase